MRVVLDAGKYPTNEGHHVVLKIGRVGTLIKNGPASYWVKLDNHGQTIRVNSGDYMEYDGEVDANGYMVFGDAFSYADN